MNILNTMDSITGLFKGPTETVSDTGYILKKILVKEGMNAPVKTMIIKLKNEILGQNSSTNSDLNEKPIKTITESTSAKRVLSAKQIPCAKTNKLKKEMSNKISDSDKGPVTKSIAESTHPKSKLST